MTLLRDDGSGHAAWVDRHVEDLNKPYGLALRGNETLVTDQDGIWRAVRPVPPQPTDQLPPDQRKPVPGAYGAEMLTKKGVFVIIQGHQNRHLAIDPKSGALYVGVHSSGNLGVEPEPTAAIQRFDADGSNQTTVASGTRNPTALAFLRYRAGPQRGPRSSSASKDELAQNFAAEHEIGRRFRVDPNDLPAPKTQPIVTNRSLTVPFHGQTLQVSPGFTATPFANPPRLLVLPNGDVLVAEQGAGYLTLMRDDGQGRAPWIDRHVEGHLQIRHNISVKELDHD